MEEEEKRAGFLTPVLSGFIATLVMIGFGALVFTFAGQQAEAYGYGVFCAVPVGLGFISSMLVDPEGEALTFKRCAITMLWALFFPSLSFFVFGAEGFVCLAMAAPLAIPLGLVGAALAYGSRVWIRSIHQKRMSSFVIVGFVPMMLTKDVVAPLHFVPHVESSALVIDAPPDKVWPLLCNLQRLPPPKHLLFRAGIAYPLEVETKGAKVGGRRTCRLSTGDMPEVIEAFEPERRLEFKVIRTPPCMVETSLYGQIQTKHLKGYFECRRGRFRLERLPGNRTRLIGTTWYESRYAPDAYWTLWNDTIVEQVHQRVMIEIKRRAELSATHG
jgi:hypothetical protein